MQFVIAFVWHRGDAFFPPFIVYRSLCAVILCLVPFFWGALSVTLCVTFVICGLVRRVEAVGEGRLFFAKPANTFCESVQRVCVCVCGLAWKGQVAGG